MADPVGSLEKIVKLALRIKQAVDTVRQNKEECEKIRRCALRISSLLSLLPETAVAAAGPAVCGALEDLEDSLRRAHELVEACCQEPTVCPDLLHALTAGRQARRLRRVQDDISHKVMLAIFATNIQTTIIVNNIWVGNAAPPPVPAGLGTTIAPPPQVAPCNLSADDDPRSANTQVSRHTKPVRRRMRLMIERVKESGIHPKAHTVLRKFSLSELEAATHRISQENMVGSGAFATIYKGILQDGLEVAIKKFRNPYVLSEEHIEELHRISMFEHKNIVKLIGYGSGVLEMPEQFEDAKFGAKEDKEASVFFIEEYMPNGSLDKIINGLQLDWSSRFLVIQGIALGLRYLHKGNVVHLDVKPSSILLDSDMNAKIADFGIARVLKHQKGVDICDISTIAGTLGYMPPEYVTDGILSKKHDVYGFGVTLLEVICGMTRSKGASGQASISWGWEARQAGRMAAELLDLSVLNEEQLKQIERCLEVGLLCTQFDPADRPDMLEAIEMLRGERELRTPVRPGYLLLGSDEANSSWFGGWTCLRVRL